MKRTWIVLPCLSLLIVLGPWASLGLQRWWPLPGPQSEPVLDRAMRARTIDTLVATLHARYVFPDKAREIEATLRQRQREGAYDAIRDGYALARQLTADVRGVVPDVHLMVRFAPGIVLPEEADGPAPASLAEWEERNNVFMRLIMRHTATRGMVRVGRLGGNIGYLKIAGFPEAFLMADKYAAAMDQLADTDGLIIDLRGNRGGDPQSVALLLSYFVDRRTRLNDIWDRESGDTIQHWTQDALDGERYGGKKPVLILVGPETVSAGEDFAYTMQALKRATLLGERTMGGAHPASPHRIGADFYVVVPSQRSISPITGGNWEGVGVTPDIVVESDNALAAAETRMRRRVQAGAPPAAARP